MASDGLTHTIGHDISLDIMSSVTIARPVHEVYAFYADMTHFPQFLGDVMDVEPAGPNRYRWTIQGPMGIPVHWVIDILKARPDAMLCYGTEVAAGLRGTWTTTFETSRSGRGHARHPASAYALSQSVEHDPHPDGKIAAGRSRGQPATAEGIAGNRPRLHHSARGAGEVQHSAVEHSVLIESEPKLQFIF